MRSIKCWPHVTCTSSSVSRLTSVNSGGPNLRPVLEDVKAMLENPAQGLCARGKTVKWAAWGRVRAAFVARPPRIAEVPINAVCRKFDAISISRLIVTDGE
jgi:hypothetical protein